MTLNNCSTLTGSCQVALTRKPGSSTLGSIGPYAGRRLLAGVFRVPQIDHCRCVGCSYPGQVCKAPRAIFPIVDHKDRTCAEENDACDRMVDALAAEV